jgi:hypothetical protein
MKGVQRLRQGLRGRQLPESAQLLPPPSSVPEDPLNEPSEASGVFSCVIDADPRFQREALRWYASLSRCVGVEPHNLILHAVGGGDSPVLGYLRDQGVVVVEVEPFDERSPHCNKISGALSLAARGTDGIAVLTDADFVFLEDARRIPLPPNAFGYRADGYGNPPADVLEKIFAAAGLQAPERVPRDFARKPGKWTLTGHANGGLYLVHGSRLPELAGRWSVRSRWLLDNRELLERWGTFVDQAAMTLATVEVGLEPYKLGLRWNLPSQNPKRIPEDPPLPLGIHYHGHVSEDGPLLPTGSDVVDREIARVNEAIADVWREAQPPRA